MTYQNIAYWVGQANDVSTGAHPTGWTTGQRWSETAGEWQAMYGTSSTDLTNMTTSRDYWQNTVAHNDPNVYTNRYNDGYTQATTDKQPPAAVSELTASAAEFLYSGIQNYCAVTVNRTGYWFVVAQATSVTVSAGILLRFTFNGSFLGDSYNWNPPTNNEKIGTLVCTAARLITSGQQIVFAGDAGGTAARTGTHTLRAIFVPTVAYPH